MGWHQLVQQPTVCGHDDNSVAILRRRQRKDDRQTTATRYGYGVFRRTERYAPLHALTSVFRFSWHDEKQRNNNFCSQR